MLVKVFANTQARSITCCALEEAIVATGDQDGNIQIWYMHPFSEWNVKLPVESWLREQMFWKAHTAAIISVRLVVSRWQVLTASADCTMSLWTLHGECIGCFGRTGLWRTELALPQLAVPLTTDAHVETKVFSLGP